LLIGIAAVVVAVVIAVQAGSITAVPFAVWMRARSCSR
jgi:cytosine/uracil/thiamine/allantoin permease